MRAALLCVVAAVYLTGCSTFAPRAVSKVIVGGIEVVDEINERFEPFKEFTRPAVLPPDGAEHLPVEQRLAALADYWEVDLSSRGFVHENDMFYVQQILTDMGDLAIWQGFYTAFRAFKAKKDGTPASRAKLDRAVEGLGKYVNTRLVRGVAAAGFPLDTYVKDPSKAGQYFDRDGRVHRDDASLDSLAGWLFGSAVVMKLFPGGYPAFEAAVADFARQFEADGYKLRNRDGTPTQHGDCSPGDFQAPLRNMAAAAVMLLGDAAGYSNQEWKRIADDYKIEFENTEVHFLWKHGWFNDNLSMIVGAAYAAMSEGRSGHEEAVNGLGTLLIKKRKTGNSFFIYGSKWAGASVTARDLANADKILSEFSLSPNFPNGKIPVETINSNRTDIEIVSWGGQQVATQPLPVWQRPASDVIWQRSPFTADGWQSIVDPPYKYSGLDFLLAYYIRQFLAP